MSCRSGRAPAPRAGYAHRPRAGSAPARRVRDRRKACRARAAGCPTAPGRSCRWSGSAHRRCRALPRTACNRSPHPQASHPQRCRPTPPSHWSRQRPRARTHHHLGRPSRCGESCASLPPPRSDRDRRGRSREPVQPGLLRHAMHVQSLHLRLMAPGDLLPSLALDQYLRQPSPHLRHHRSLVQRR
jgi:hypothetical protein